MGRFGKYMACTNDDCKRRKILRNGEVAPPKESVPLPELPCEKSDAYFVLRDGAGGIPAANTFPKSRETRAPLVEELYRFRDRLPENSLPGRCATAGSGRQQNRGALQP
ncbi:hypothetical protein ACVXG7_11590 [Enterobacter hormaechei]